MNSRARVFDDDDDDNNDDQEDGQAVFDEAESESEVETVSHYFTDLTALPPAKRKLTDAELAKSAMEFNQSLGRSISHTQSCVTRQNKLWKKMTCEGYEEIIRVTEQARRHLSWVVYYASKMKRVAAQIEDISPPSTSPPPPQRKRAKKHSSHSATTEATIIDDDEDVDDKV